MAPPPPFSETQQPAAGPEADLDELPSYEMAMSTAPPPPQIQQRQQQQQQRELQPTFAYPPIGTYEYQSHNHRRHNHHHNNRRSRQNDRFYLAQQQQQQQQLQQQQQQQQQQPRIGGPLGAALGGPVHGPIGAVFWIAGSPFRLGNWGVTAAAEKSRAKTQNQARANGATPEQSVEVAENRNLEVEREGEGMEKV